MLTLDFNRGAIKIYRYRNSMNFQLPQQFTDFFVLPFYFHLLFSINVIVIIIFIPLLEA